MCVPKRIGISSFLGDRNRMQTISIKSEGHHEHQAPHVKETCQNVHVYSEFYKKNHMLNRAKLMVPLTKLTKDNAKFEWKEEQQQALDTVKAKCSESMMLACSKTNEPFHSHADACDVKIGGVLTQDNKR